MFALLSVSTIKVANVAAKTEPYPIMAEMVCDVVHCPTVRNQHSMFNPRLADIINPFAHFPIWQN